MSEASQGSKGISPCPEKYESAAVKLIQCDLTKPHTVHSHKSPWAKWVDWPPKKETT